MSDRLRRLRRLAPVALAGLLAAAGAQAQSWYRPYREGGDFAPPPRGQQDRPPPRPFADPDRAANAAREATGGRVLGVQGADRDGQPGYRVRILQPDGRVRSLHFDPASGRMRD
ncbi:MAG: hypothetical protein RKR03_19910 [Candidatus Competibacter sp.]|nr:hypothetical protein [Candidatus Competibacter sp.]MDS4070795.1 hypothetical protein [Candidatus Competibacter sp.]